MSCSRIIVLCYDPPICLYDIDGDASFQALIASINGLMPRIAITRFML